MTDLQQGKGRPTPTRKQQEASNKRPIVVADRKEARRLASAQARVDRERANAGMAAGDEKFLAARDKGAQKRYVRDWVDARWSLGEFLIPVMVVIIVAMYFPIPDVQNWSVVAMVAYVVLVVADSLVLGQQIQKKIAAKFGADRAERVRWYAITRATQLRPLRLPKPQVKRGQYPA